MDATPHETFGSLLRSYRRIAGITQEELAERAGVSADTISNLERDIAHTPRKETIRLLAEALGLRRSSGARKTSLPYTICSATPPPACSR